MIPVGDLDSVTTEQITLLECWLKHGKQRFGKYGHGEIERAQEKKWRGEVIWRPRLSSSQVVQHCQRNGLIQKEHQPERRAFLWALSPASRRGLFQLSFVWTCGNRPHLDQLHDPYPELLLGRSLEEQQRQFNVTYKPRKGGVCTFFSNTAVFG